MSSLGRLAAGVAHEINNPLTGILTYSCYLLKRTKDNKEIQSDLEVIVNETKRSREIVKGLLDFARQSVPKKNKADINAIINKAVAVIDNQIKAAEIDLIREFDENLPQVVVDANQLEQVFINLIVNAIQASEEEGSKITVSTSLMTMDPYGVYQVKNAVCPKGHSLMDQTVKINGMPTIRVKVRTEGKSGFVNLDPVYGLNRNNFGIKIDADSKYDLTCPKCDTSLLDKTKKCPKCGGAVYFYEIPGKGRFEGCAQSGGEWQSWPEIDKEGKKKFIVIKVTDEGCGIPQENLSKIFEPFFTTKGQRGTGLGLAVIWGIIDKHDGRITVDSKQGQGSTFTIRLPVEKDTESY
ncbi:MAG: hypothetical protein JXB44_08985 [Calditrichaceae bacterium]|nr:hypothetical protein [Calditrichaceae bacterium]